MASDIIEQPTAGTADETLLTAEPIGFTADQMVNCDKCGKSNPPTRFACLYCAASLRVSTDAALRKKLVLRLLEPWEYGVNFVVLGKAGEEAVQQASNILGTDAQWLRAVIETGKPLPIARVESAASEPVEKMLSSLGVECRLVTDRELNCTAGPLRLRGIKFLDGFVEFVVFNTGKSVRVATAQISHLVSGSLYRSRTQVLEKHSRRERRLLDEAQTSEDEVVVDIYTNNDRLGFRVMQHGFDFSVLGEGIDLLAHKNMGRLVEKIVAFAPQIANCDDYNDVRHLLGNVWPPEDKKDAKGVKRSGLGRLDLSSVRSSDNLLQFTKYSRLQSLF